MALSPLSCPVAGERFDHQPSIRVQFGAGMLAQLGESCLQLGGKRVLLVTDPGLEAVGYDRRAVATMQAAGLEIFKFDGVEENPTTLHVEACRDYALQVKGIDLIVALGGGSVMDCAKGANFLLSNGGNMADYWGKGKARQKMLPSIGIPTTAGTGSEAQCFALISHAKTHQKMACGDLKARFHTVLLDPELVVTVPPLVAANTGMDAVTHAVESFVTNCRNALSQLYAREAWRLLEGNFERVLGKPDDLEAWGRMMMGSHFAGAAIEHSMLGAAHACANPLTARFGLAHGAAVALMLPWVIRFNGPTVAPLYAELAALAALGPGDPVELLACRIEAMRSSAGLPKQLSALGVAPQDLPGLAQDALNQWTGTFNPRPLNLEHVTALYHAAL